MMTTHPQTQGFTLVETLVAIAILMIAIIGPFYSIQQAITSSYTSRDQLIATALAQEGVEYMYFVRNNNYLASPSNPWTQGMDPCFVSVSPNGCTVDPSLTTTSLALSSCSGSTCPALKLNNSGIYTQGSGAPTRFTRTVKITVVSSQEITVSSQVSWSTNHQSFTTSATEEFYNWL